MPIIPPPGMQMLNITLENGRVIIQFATPTQEMHMTPQDAANFSAALFEAAKDCYNKWHRANDYSLSPESDVLKGGKPS